MLVQDLNRVHRRYITLSNAFKSAWTFHQFLQGLRKVFIDRAPTEYDVDFQGLYGELRQISEGLTELAAEEIDQQLDGIEQKIRDLIAILLSVDEQVSPALLRHFFQKVKNFDDNILTQLVKFYIYSRNGTGWQADRLDKADFVSTKLCEEHIDRNDTFAIRDHSRMREVAQGLWTTLGVPALAENVVSGLCNELVKIRKEVQAIDSIDSLASNQLVQRYRHFKHALGDSFFEPRVLQQIVETNLALKNGIHKLYRREEERIVAEYQQIFELEREVPVGVELGGELRQFRQAVDKFEKRLQGSDIRLDELAQLRQQVRDLIPRLRPIPIDVEPTLDPSEVQQLQSPASSPEAPPQATTEDAHLEVQYRAIIAALDEVAPATEPKKASLMPEVFSLGVTPREVVAYRRLFGSSTTPCDRKLEEFLLRAVALRLRVAQEVEEIKGILDDSALTREATVFKQAATTCRLGDLFLRQFDHLIEQMLLADQHREVKSLRVLKMRLMRNYSGLWLLLYRD